MEVSDVTDGLESKIVKVKSQTHVDYVLQCEEHSPQRVLATESNDQSVRLQGYSVAYALLSARGTTRVVSLQIVTASPMWSCRC